MHHGTTPHRRSVCAPLAIRDPVWRNTRLLRGGCGVMKMSEGTGEFCKVLRVTSFPDGIWSFLCLWDSLRYEIIQIHLLYSQILSNTNTICI